MYHDLGDATLGRVGGKKNAIKRPPSSEAACERLLQMGIAHMLR